MLIGLGLVSCGVIAIVYRENEKKAALEAIQTQGSTPPSSEKPQKLFSRPPVAMESPYGQKVDYELKPSPKGSVKLLINGKETLYLISDLRPIPCPEKKGAMCLSLRTGSYIEASLELRKTLPVEYQYFQSH